MTKKSKILPVIILAAAAAGGYWYYQKKKKADQLSKGINVEEAATAEEEEAGKEEAKKGLESALTPSSAPYYPGYSSGSNPIVPVAVTTPVTPQPITIAPTRTTADVLERNLITSGRSVRASTITPTATAPARTTTITPSRTTFLTRPTFTAPARPAAPVRSAFTAAARTAAPVRTAAPRSASRIRGFDDISILF